MLSFSAERFRDGSAAYRSIVLRRAYAILWSPQMFFEFYRFSSFIILGTLFSGGETTIEVS